MLTLRFVEQVDYLVKRKFGNVSKAPPPISMSVHSSFNREAHQKLLAEIKAYENTLYSKPPSAVEELYNQEKAKEIEQLKIKSELEEKQRFFNLKSADADFVHWSKAAHWSLDEATALSFGKDPKVVSWKKVEPYASVSSFAKEYEKRRDLALRAVPWKKLFDPVLPSIFLSWANEVEIEVPLDLIAQVKKMGGIAIIWFEEYRKLKVTYDELQKNSTLEQDCKEKPLNNMERETLLVVITALAKEAKVDITKTSKAGDIIANLTQLIGAPIGATTIETHLKKIPQALASRAK